MCVNTTQYFPKFSEQNYRLVTRMGFESSTFAILDTILDTALELQNCKGRWFQNECIVYGRLNNVVMELMNTLV